MSCDPILVPTADTVVELLRQQAARLGEKVAFSYSYDGGGRDGSQLTYRELDTRARGVAAALQRMGAAGERALVLCQPGLDGIAGVFGCLYAGSVAVPVSARVGPILAAVIADAQVRFAIASPQMPQSIRSAVDTLIGRADGEPVQWCDADEGEADDWTAPSVEADSVALIQYSLGAIRCPKGVVVTHDNLMTNLEAIGSAGLGDHHDVAVSWLPVHHGIGLVGGVLASIYLGASTILMAPSAVIARPMCWLEAVSRWRASLTMAPDFAYRLCVHRSTPAQRAGLDLSSLSTAVIAGEPVPAATMHAFAEAFAPVGFRTETFTPVYGVAEATWLVSGGSETGAPTVCHVDRGGLASGWIADAHPDDLDAVAIVGCGRPRQPVVIVDPDTGSQCGPDEVGEIWVSGPGVVRSYWNAPAQSDQIFEAFLADGGGGPFLRTGDRGFIRRGQLFVTGRYPGLVLLGGVHYYPQHLEATVADSHAVLLTGRGVAFADETEQLVVVHEVRCAVGATELDRLVELIQSALFEHHGVAAVSILLVAAMGLPTSPGGEIRRGACRWQYLDGDLDTVAQWHAPSWVGSTSQPRDGNVVAFAESAAARQLRVSRS